MDPDHTSPHFQPQCSSSNGHAAPVSEDDLSGNPLDILSPTITISSNQPPVNDVDVNWTCSSSLSPSASTSLAPTSPPEDSLVTLSSHDGWQSTHLDAVMINGAPIQPVLTWSPDDESDSSLPELSPPDGERSDSTTTCSSSREDEADVHPTHLVSSEPKSLPTESDSIQVESSEQLLVSKEEWLAFACQQLKVRVVTQAGTQPPPHVWPPTGTYKRSRANSDPEGLSLSTSTLQGSRGIASSIVSRTSRKRFRRWSPVATAEEIRVANQMRDTRVRVDEQFIAAIREPPINMRTLRPLDIGEILRNSQLRHDLLFDNLMFRPIRSVAASTSYVGLLADGTAGIVEPSVWSEASNRYWACIRAEIESGCRCTRWEQNTLTRTIQAKVCICGQWRRDLNEASWWRLCNATWPSRLPKLITSLREVLQSLMTCSTTCSTKNKAVHSNSSGLPLNTSTCPAVSHTLVPELFASLDPEFLTVQVRRGVFNLDIFRAMGIAMKAHCAPVRDAMVDDMVDTATGSDGQARDVITGLRKCFDCIEVMKLDIANHHVHVMRPALWRQADINETTAFTNSLVAAGRTLETSITRSWIRAASYRVLYKTPPRERKHLIGKCSCQSNSEFVMRSLINGFVELVFSNWLEPTESWPPIVWSRATGALFAEPVMSPKLVLPEVFKLDARKLKMFNTELIDLTINQMVILVFEDLFKKQYPLAPAAVIAQQSEFVRRDYKEIMERCNGFTRPNDPTLADLAVRMAYRIVFPRNTFHDGPRPRRVSDVRKAVLLAYRIENTLALHVRPDAEAFLRGYADLRRLLMMIMNNYFLDHRRHPDSCMFDSHGTDYRPCISGRVQPPPMAPIQAVPSSERFLRMAQQLTGAGPVPSLLRDRYKHIIKAHVSEERQFARYTGFEPLMLDIRHLTDRMFKVVGFNLAVFSPTYGSRNMLIGSGTSRERGSRGH